MQALGHFTVGVASALLVLTFVDRPVHEEFLWTFASGFWAVVPDGHWLVREFGLVDLAEPWLSVHSTPWANVFWFPDARSDGHPGGEQGHADTER